MVWMFQILNNEARVTVLVQLLLCATLKFDDKYLYQGINGIHNAMLAHFRWADVPLFRKPESKTTKKK